MSEENVKKLEDLEALTQSGGWALVYEKALIYRDNLYSKALSTTDSVIAKQCLEQIKGIEFVLNLPQIQYKEIQFQTKKEEIENGE